MTKTRMLIAALVAGIVCAAVGLPVVGVVIVGLLITTYFLLRESRARDEELENFNPIDLHEDPRSDHGWLGPDGRMFATPLAGHAYFEPGLLLEYLDPKVWPDVVKLRDDERFWDLDLPDAQNEVLCLKIFDGRVIPNGLVTEAQLEFLKRPQTRVKWGHAQRALRKSTVVKVEDVTPGVLLKEPRK